MYLSELQSQTNSVSQMTKHQVQGYEQLQKAISDFTLNSPFLTGQTYESAKAYFSTVLFPLAQGGILLSEAVEQAVKQFPATYISDVANGDLKQAELEEKISQADSLITQAEELARQLQSSTMSDISKSVQLSANEKMIGLYGTVKRELEEKLRKLVLFNYTSASIFAEITVLEAAVKQGLDQTIDAFSSSTGSFSLPSKDELAWRTTIIDKLKEKDQAGAEAEKTIVEKE